VDDSILVLCSVQPLLLRTLLGVSLHPWRCRRAMTRRLALLMVRGPPARASFSQTV
jgi:hypothetical protein